MSFAALVITISVIWLTWRAVQLWSLPLTVVLRYLQIDIPSAPHLTMDGITSDSVSLHWAPPVTQVKRHIIQMDGQEVGVSLKGETSVTISGLAADYVYSIQVIAVNAQGFQMASPALFVRTRPGTDVADDTKLKHEPHVQAFKTKADGSVSNLKTPRKRGSYDVKAKESAQGPSQTTETRRAEPNLIIESLKGKMDGIRKETAEIDAQISAITESHAQEEATFHKKLEDLRLKKKEEDEAKTAKDLLHKQLDQQKRELESRRNQAQKALKVERDECNKQTTDIASFLSSVKNSTETVEHLQELMVTMKTDTDEAVQEATRAGTIAAEEVSEIESEIRYLLTRKAEAEAELADLRSSDRQPTPSAQELAEIAQADAAWREREDSLIKQYEDAQSNLHRAQTSPYGIFDSRNIGTPSSDPGMEHTAVRRRVSRRARTDDLGRPESAGRGQVHPAFNPDAAPFIASATSYTTNEHNIRPMGPNPGFPTLDQYNPQTFNPHTAFAQHNDLAFPIGRNNFQAPSGHATSSIFSDDPLFQANPAIFRRRDSPKSSASGSNPPSPAIQTRAALPSIFNSTPNIATRTTPAGSLLDRLNGTLLADPHDVVTAAVTANGSKWSWPAKKKIANDPLALDRKNTRSLPKVDVAPIGTRRNRSGSLREEQPPTRGSPAATLNGYHDPNILDAIGHPLSRETSLENDGFSTSAVPLPRPSNGRAFGWEPPIPALQRHLPNPWNTTDGEHGLTGAPRAFDPFGDLGREVVRPELSGPVHQPLGMPGPSTAYHTTIDVSRLSNLDREHSNSSRRSGKSKAESQESREKVKRLGEHGKFSSFVGRVFGKKDERDGRTTEGEGEGDHDEDDGSVRLSEPASVYPGQL